MIDQASQLDTSQLRCYSRLRQGEHVGRSCTCTSGLWESGGPLTAVQFCSTITECESISPEESHICIHPSVVAIIIMQSIRLAAVQAQAQEMWCGATLCATLYNTSHSRNSLRTLLCFGVTCHLLQRLFRLWRQLRARLLKTRLFHHLKVPSLPQRRNQAKN